MAKANPEINHRGWYSKSVLSYALDKVLATDVPNIKLLWVDGSDLTDYFEGARLTAYLNFSDPWPRKRHEKRRLTYQSLSGDLSADFAGKWKSTSKTDNPGLFGV